MGNSPSSGQRGFETYDTRDIDGAGQTGAQKTKHVNSVTHSRLYCRDTYRVRRKSRSWIKIY